MKYYFILIASAVIAVIAVIVLILYYYFNNIYIPESIYTYPGAVNACKKRYLNILPHNKIGNSYKGIGWCKDGIVVNKMDNKITFHKLPEQLKLPVYCSL